MGGGVGANAAEGGGMKGIIREEQLYFHSEQTLLGVTSFCYDMKKTDCAQGNGLGFWPLTGEPVIQCLFHILFTPAPWMGIASQNRLF